MVWRGRNRRFLTPATGVRYIPEPSLGVEDSKGFRYGCAIFIMDLRGGQVRICSADTSIPGAMGSGQQLTWAGFGASGAVSLRSACVLRRWENIPHAQPMIRTRIAARGEHSARAANDPRAEVETISYCNLRKPARCNLL